MSVLRMTSVFLTKWRHLEKSLKQVERIEERTTRIETKTQKKLFNIYFFIGLTVIFIRIAKRTPIVFASARTPANRNVAFCATHKHLQEAQGSMYVNKVANCSVVTTETDFNL